MTSTAKLTVAFIALIVLVSIVGPIWQSRSHSLGTGTGASPAPALIEPPTKDIPTGHLRAGDDFLRDYMDLADRRKKLLARIPACYQFNEGLMTFSLIVPPPQGCPAIPAPTSSTAPSPGTANPTSSTTPTRK